MSKPKVALIMGSDRDLVAMTGCIKNLRTFGIEFEAHVISAHRTPEKAEKFARSARENGFGAIIAGAGMAAHLAGVIAAYTTLPVIGVPIKSNTLDGMDALLSMVQMPRGIPVACMAIDGSENAAILAAEILSLNDEDLAFKLAAFKANMAEEVEKKDIELRDSIDTIK